MNDQKTTTIAEPGKSKDIATLINELQDPAVGEKHGRAVALISPGRWDHFIQWASANGYTFTAKEIADELRRRPALTKRLAEHPVMSGWSNDSLTAHIAKEKKR